MCEEPASRELRFPIDRGWRLALDDLEYVLGGKAASTFPEHAAAAAHKTNGFIACRLFATVAQKAQQARKAGLRRGLN
jgi:hypothetical protein